jgi:hypothetical protein
VLTFGPTLTFRHYTALPIHDLFDLSPSDIDRLLSNPPTVVLVDESSLDSQWANQPPAQNFERVRAARTLEPLGSRGSFTLYRVGRPKDPATLSLIHTVAAAAEDQIGSGANQIGSGAAGRDPSAALQGVP